MYTSSRILNTLRVLARCGERIALKTLHFFANPGTEPLVTEK
jgi:hypothetical protein